MTDSGPKFLVVARVNRPHGVRGDLRVQALTSFPERMKTLDLVYFGPDPDDQQNLVEGRITHIRPDKSDFWLMHLEGIDDREAAEVFRGRYILVSLADAVPLEDDEVYLFQVMGLEVVTLAGERLGRVVDIIETGANDVYVVRGETYGEVLVPAIESVIVRIDVEGGTMTIRPMAGLLPE